MDIDFYWGCDMHTYTPQYGDSYIWSLPEGVVIDDDKLYCIKYDTHYPSDPMDMSSFTRVYEIEEVPADILEYMEQIKKAKAAIVEYKRNFANGQKSNNP